MRIEPTDRVVGARVFDLSLNTPPAGSILDQLEDALETYGVLIFPNQTLCMDEQIAFTQQFGELMLNSAVKAGENGHSHVLAVGNTTSTPVTFAPTDPTGELEWHTDQIQYETPARASLLYAHIVPATGGDTLFACMYHAYDTLSDEQRELCNTLEAGHSVEGLHDYLESVGLGHSFTRRTAYDTFWRPLVRRHPRSGRPALYFGSHITTSIRGWEPAAARDFVRTLAAHATRPQFQYQHKWRVGDAVLWDNRRVLHAGTPWDMQREKRLLHRTLVLEDQPIR